MATGWPMKTTYANGDVYAASDVNDITGTINLLGSSVAYTAGKNKIINGDFGVWQRGTTFSGIVEGNFFADRYAFTSTAGGSTATASRQTFTPGTAPVAGYEGSYFARLALTSGSGSTTAGMFQKIEDVRTFAGQSVTLSFWAKADSARTLTIYTQQNFGSGGSGAVTTSTTVSVTTSWQRFTYSLSLASISGKTIGTNSFLYIAVEFAAGQASGSLTFDTWGWQLEAGSTATAFQTATGTIQGELAACQRYYFRTGGTNAYQVFGQGIGSSSTQAVIAVILPVQMRVGPGGIDFSSLSVRDTATFTTVTGVTDAGFSANVALVNAAVASGLTQYRPYFLQVNNNINAYIGFSAEL